MIPDGANCCWRHWIGLPVREGVRHPYYKFQEQWIDEFTKYEYFWMEKPPKVGATEIYLHLFMHMAAINPAWKNGQVAIVVGTSGLSEAEHMIQRCKQALQNVNYGGEDEYNTRKEFTINTVQFKAHPADRIDSIRSQPNMRAILVDEGAFFKQVEQTNVRSAAEHYIMGAKIKLVWISTAGDSPSGAFYDIGLEPDVTSTTVKGVYRHYVVNYEDGTVKHPESNTTLYFVEDIEKAKTLGTFGRNFLHIWGHGSGNIFTHDDLTKCTPETDHGMLPEHGQSLLNIDPAYGSGSKFGIVGMVKVNGKIHITEAYQLDRPNPVDMFNHIKEKSKRYDAVTYDGHWAGDIRALGEMGVNVQPIIYSDNLMKMTQRSAEKVEKHLVVFKQSHRELIGQLRAIVYNEKGVPDKKKVKFDMGDAFMQGIHYLYDEGVGVAYEDP